MDSVATLRIAPGADGSPDRVRSVLADHLRCEQLTARRRFLTSLLAVLSLPVWLAAMWPQLLAGPDRRFLLYLFGCLLALASWAAAEEWRATSRLRQGLGATDAVSDDGGRGEQT